MTICSGHVSRLQLRPSMCQNQRRPIRCKRDVRGIFSPRGVGPFECHQNNQPPGLLVLPQHGTTAQRHISSMAAQGSTALRTQMSKAICAHGMYCFSWCERFRAVWGCCLCARRTQCFCHSSLSGKSVWKECVCWCVRPQCACCLSRPSVECSVACFLSRRSPALNCAGGVDRQSASRGGQQDGSNAEERIIHQGIKGGAQ